jgi:hypothetical protein
MRSREHMCRTALTMLFVALLAVPAHALITENVDVIWTIPGDTALQAFGSSLASGDVNGDGVPDIVVASDMYCEESLPRTRRGMAEIYYGNHVGDSAPDLVLRSPTWKGANPPVLACGDLNGDGYVDIAMGEDMADSGYGMCTIWLGGNPMDTVPACVIRSRNVWWLNGGFGRDITIGDVNGDGYDDLVVGAYYSAERPGEFGTGRVYVFYGGPDGIDTIPDVILRGGHDGEYEGFGIGISAEGDFDHDGFHDLYIGAWQYGSDDRGRGYVYYGGNPMDTSFDMAMSGEGVAHFFGFEKPGALSAQGNFDYAVEGNELWPHGAYNPGANCGKVYVHQGGRPMDSIPDVELLGSMDSANLGYAAQSAGDVTDDGNDDLVAGAPYSWPPSATGAAYLWETGNHFDKVPDAWVLGDAAQQVVGERVCTAGDIDGDGRSEFMISNYSSYPRQHLWVCKYTGLGIEDEKQRPLTSLRLDVAPNPARGAFLVRYEVTSPSRVSVGLYDVGGRLVRSLSEGEVAPGRYEAKLPSGVLPAGVYICTLDNGATRISRKVVLTE